MSDYQDKKYYSILAFILFLIMIVSILFYSYQSVFESIGIGIKWWAKGLFNYQQEVKYEEIDSVDKIPVKEYETIDIVMAPPVESSTSTSHIASWYDYDLKDYPDYSKDHRTCASRDYPRKTILKVTNLDNERWIKCRVNDYGPEEETGRDIDLSSYAFEWLAPLSRGLIDVRIEVYK